MRAVAVVAICLATAVPSIAHAQQQSAAPSGARATKAKRTAHSTVAPVTWNRLTGTWNGRAYRAKTDSVISRFSLTFSPSRKATVQRQIGPQAPVRVLAMRGDSVVVEYGPLPSITRPGHTATMREVLHVKGDAMRGSLHATFDDGRTLNGRVELTRHRMP